MNIQEKENKRRCLTPVIIKVNQPIQTNQRSVFTSHEMISNELDVNKTMRHDCITPCTLHADFEVFSILQNSLHADSNSDNSDEVVERCHRPGLL